MITLQTILYPNKDICSEEALYYHKDESFLLFDGYFNLFYLEKHHKYCDIGRLTLELLVRGIKSITLMHDRDEIRIIRFDETPVSGMDRLRGKKTPIETTERISLELPYKEYEKGVFWFKAQVADMEGDFCLEGYYGGSAAQDEEASKPDETLATSQSHISSVELAVNICTYKRESYVARNTKAVTGWFETKDIDGKTKEAAEHLHFFIVDNGKTLSDNKEFVSAAGRFLEGEDGRIHVIENANTGGAGGFGRGMLEAINRRSELSLSHLLMMDDDTVFDPELFVRLFGFLSVLKSEYSMLTVGGALMREDYKYIQHAAGEEYKNFKVINHNLMEDMRSFENCTGDWVMGTEKEHEQYGAWWCCCYNMDVVTKENLPLPIFIHQDDIQFGLRLLENGIVFLNGINVWHRGFEMTFPGTRLYYDIRNALITGQMYAPEILKKKIKGFAIRQYIGMLISYRYADCELVYRGLMDFLKGKQWLLAIDPEELNDSLREEYGSLSTVSSYDYIKEYVKDIPAELSIEEIRGFYSHARFDGSMKKILTFNGWFLPGDNEVKVITPLDSPWDTYRHKRVLLYEPGAKTGTFTKRSIRELLRGFGRIIRMSAAVDVWKMRGGEW